MLESEGKIYIMHRPDKSPVNLEPVWPGHKEGRVVMKWGSDSRSIIGVYDHQSYIIWNAESGKVMENSLAENPDYVLNIQFSNHLMVYET